MPKPVRRPLTAGDIFEARRITTKAIRDGVLKRPKRCTVCHLPSGRIEAHHLDYHRPLKIKWCCKKCHARLDAKRRKMERDNDLRTRYGALRKLDNLSSDSA